MQKITFITITLLALCLFGLNGCSAPAITQAAAQEDGTCGVRPFPGYFDGQVQPGNYCDDAQDCQPNCCNCTEPSNKSWLAVACVDNECADLEVACALTKEDSVYCN